MLSQLINKSVRRSLVKSSLKFCKNDLITFKPVCLPFKNLVIFLAARYFSFQIKSGLIECVLVLSNIVLNVLLPIKWNTGLASDIK